MPQLSSPTQPPYAAAAVDGELVARAIRKVVDRKELTQAEREALKRHEKQKEERLRWQYYSSIPQKHWRQMSGRQTKVLNEQARRYGIPFGGPTINLPNVVAKFHDFLADNAQKLARDADDMLAGPASAALERYREERAVLAKLDRLERERSLLPRDQVREFLGRLAAILRGAGDTLQRQFGPEAVRILHECLDESRREMDRFFGEANGAADDAPDTS